MTQYTLKLVVMNSDEMTHLQLHDDAIQLQLGDDMIHLQLGFNKY